MKTSLKAENRGWPRENAKNTGWPTGTKNDRIMAGQNHNERHRSVLMILSCHHSVWPPRLQKKRKRDFEQEATERTEIRKAKPLCLGSMAICRPLTRVIYSFESALCSLLCLLFKPIWLRSSLCALCVLLWQSSLAGVHYVDANSTNATAPYTNWTTAATNIQGAVDAAAAGEEIVVTNGTYATGGRAVHGTMTNRVAVDKPLTLRSVNGPQFTIIQGSQVPGTTNGDGAIRCIYLTNGASLSGFTLTNGATRAVNDYPTNRESSGGGLWCEPTNTVVVSNCVVTGNSAYHIGGGAYGGTANKTGNSASYGGGGGASGGTLNNCTLTGNWASYDGGGAYYCTLNNCTLTGNWAPYGGGAVGGLLNNCILYFNTAANYDSYSTLNYCCTAPLPTSGVGNISLDPQLASSSHLSTGSPCRGAGNAAYATGTDIDGEAWANPPSIGCDEYHAGAMTGPLSVGITASHTTVLRGFMAQLTALIEGRATVSIWDFGDGITSTNQPYASHAWAAPGDYAVVLRAYNESQPGGISATVTIHVGAGTVLYVAAASANPVWPYTSWATAATNIQDAVGAASVPGALVLVTDGTYLSGTVHLRSGGTIYSRVEVGNSLTVRSVNGPQVTVIYGGADVASGASLSGFSLTHGIADRGGGVYCESQTAVVSNCVVSGNVAADYEDYYNHRIVEGYGGGAYGGTLNNCTLSENLSSEGGGAAYCTLNNCTLTGNSAGNYNAYYANGGGAYECTLNNCTLSGNYADVSSDSSLHAAGGGAYGGTLSDCTLSYNSADSGGGAYGSVLNNCTLDGNRANAGAGGGAGGSALNNCALTGNSAFGYAAFSYPHYLHYVEGSGGGADGSALNNCTLIGNSAEHGGGASYSTLDNCALTGNSATGWYNNYPYPSGGGAAYGGTLNNCTVSGNFSTKSGGGAAAATLTNCIVYFNTATNGANYDSSSTLNYCCTTPLPTNGLGNISSDPELASASHLSPFSPCIGKGSSGAASGMDLDGEPWANPPSMGCDEYHAGAVTGPISVSITASFTNVAVGYPVDFTGSIDGRTDLSVWTLGDGALEIDQPYAAHSWSAPGDYLVSLWAFNDSYPGGISVTVTIHVVTGLHYVATVSANPIAPYTSWATAATNILDAITAATEPGASVLVTNGTYPPIVWTNGPAQGSDFLSVRSVNGPRFTVINGGHTNRCVYLGGSTTLSGFTLTNGVADYGGGAASSTLTNCVLASNSATGMYGYGGGAAYCTLNNCTLTGNLATGTYGTGGGASGGTLNNCTLSGNSANGGGGASYGTLNNCTLIGNSGANSGGGASACTLNNCISYFNTSTNGANYGSSTLNYCCTTPQPTNGLGNISLDPRLAGASHLSAGSPCRGAGNAAYASGADIDGEAWASPPSIGCDEYHPGAVTGPLSVGITASFTTVTIGFAVQFAALIEGRTAASSWDFGDGFTPTNQPYASHAWTALGDYPVVLRAYNESQPGGISATVTVHVITPPVHYVAASSANPVAPYTSWAAAAITIQDAVGAATVPGAMVLVTNGIYDTGGGNGNRVTVDKLLNLRSINGPQFTSIDGDQSVRCVYLADSATLSGFALTNGLGEYGGGVFCESQTAVVSNCVVSGNVASGYDSHYNIVEGSGGGAYGGTLNNCTLTGNSATGTYGSGGGASACTLNNCTLSRNRAWVSTYGYGGYGGGAYVCTLNNCTLTGNSATGAYGSGGGAEGCTLNNCTLTSNSATYGGGGAHSCTLNNCILFSNAPDSDYGSPGSLAGDNWIGDPLFVDWASGNLRMQSNSPCINAGNNSYVTCAPDLDGNPRMVGGTVDIGAYEFQSPASMISYAWLQQYGLLPATGSTDTADPDGDGVDNYHEWLTGTDPTNPLSSPAQLTIIPSGTNVILSWPTNAVGFTLQSTTNPSAAAVWTTNSPAPVVIGGQNVIINPISGPQQFYRLRQ